MKELTKRVLVALAGIPIALFIIYLGGIPFAALVAVISSLALWEYYNMAEKKGSRPLKKTGTVMNVVLLALFQYFIAAGSIGDGAVLFVGLLMINVLLILTIEMYTGHPGSVLNSAVTVGGLFYITLAFCFLIALRNIHLINIFGSFISVPYFAVNGEPGIRSAYLVMSTFFAVWICDTAAYFTGMAIGKHKLFARVSPKKTWEGAIGGFFGGIAGYAASTLILIPEFPIIHSVALGAIVGTIGQIGDLAESLLKRDAGVKDSSALLPGHGGALDRFDSIMFVVPVIFIYLLIVGVM